MKTRAPIQLTAGPSLRRGGRTWPPILQARPFTQYRGCWPACSLGNIIEMNAGTVAPRGISVSGDATGTGSRYYRDVIIRNNFIRHVNQATDGNALGIYVARASNLIAEDNLIGDTTSANAVTFWFVTNKNFQNNLSAAGDTLWAYDNSTNRRAPQLEDKVANNYLSLMGKKVGI